MLLTSTDVSEMIEGGRFVPFRISLSVILIIIVVVVVRLIAAAVVLIFSLLDPADGFPALHRERS